MRGDISGGRDISVPEVFRAELSFSTFTVCSIHSIHMMTPRQIGEPRYFGLEGRDSSRGKVASANVNGSPRDISRARNNFVDCAHELRGYLAPLPETS